MLRVAALLSALVLAACTTTATDGVVRDEPSVPPGVSLSLISIGDAPNRAQDLFYAAFGQSAFLADVPWDPGVSGTIQVRAYLSIVPGDTGTLLIYVFDFEDTVGRRLFRVSDRISSRLTPTDPWEIIEFDLAADVTLSAIEEFVVWVNNNNVGV